MTEALVATASGEALPAFTFESDFSSTFQPNLSIQRPRPWDRLPKSPHAKKRKGRKVWKRYEPLQRNAAKENRRQSDQRELERCELNGPADTAHTAKRLRSRDATTEQESVMGQRASRYVTTLRDKVPGTPRRKVASRRSLRLDRPKVVKQSLLGPIRMTNEATFTDELVDKTADLGAVMENEGREVVVDPVQPSEGPSSEHVAEALSSPMSESLVEEDISCDGGVEMVIDEIQDDKAGGRAPPLEEDEVILHSSFTDPPDPVTPTRELRPMTPDNTPLASDLVTTGISAGNTTAVEPETSLIGTLAGKVQAMSEPQTTHNTMTSEPQIEPSIDAINPEKGIEDVVADLPSRSEVQEQEPRRSSRHLSAKNSQSPADPETKARSTSPDTSLVEITDDVVGPADNRTTDETEPESVINSPQIEKDLKTQASEIEAQEGMVDICHAASGSEFVESVEIKEPTMQDVVEEAPNASTTTTQPGQDEKTVPKESAIRKSPRKSTRSGTRFSDDTSMLKDFLSRAQARKQAKDAAHAAEALTAARARLPRSSPRKALARLDSNSPPAQQIREVASRVSTPPGKFQLGEIQLEETETNTSPVRRSTRKRLPELAKTATGAPSLIPVRRADGTDPVVLQKSVAQELALVTRANTRRNKGQAKPPAIILKTLNVEEVEVETKGGHALRSCKSVGWDDKLVYYHDGTQVRGDGEVKVEEKRPKARRLRGLGAGNGTPAPKRQTADLLSTNGTPAPRREGRKRG
ncbi:MAG: hypothetical protein Q9207_003126 [Kuettlingeria erythrocarpa]